MIKTKTSNIRRARIEQGYSQLDICSSTGLNISSYSRIENGIVNPRPRTSKKICDFLQKPFNELFEIIEQAELQAV